MVKVPEHLHETSKENMGILFSLVDVLLLPNCRVFACPKINLLPLSRRVSIAWYIRKV